MWDGIAIIANGIHPRFATQHQGIPSSTLRYHHNASHRWIWHEYMVPFIDPKHNMVTVERDNAQGVFSETLEQFEIC